MKFKALQLTMVSALVMLAGTRQSDASLLQLTHDPLFLSQTVPPALAVTFDDSGSMAWGYMGPNYGYNTKKFTDPNYNKIYYNPNIVYRPPIGADGVEFPDSEFTDAKVDGFDFRSNAPRVDLSKNYIPIAYNYFYSQGNYSIKFARTPNTLGVSTVYTNSWSYYPGASTRNAVGTKAFYYNGNTRVDIPDTEFDRTNFANWYTFYNNRLKMGKTAVSRAFATFGPNFKIAWQQLNDEDITFPSLDKFELTHRKDFFKWLFNVPSNGNTPLRKAFYRAGELFQKSSSYYSSDFGANITCQQNFHIALSDGEWNRSFGESITQDENNLSKLPGDSGNLYGAYDGDDEQRIYPLSEYGKSLADITFHFWANDLMPTMENNVKRFKSSYTNAAGNVVAPIGPDWEDDAFIWNPKNDPAYWQHMVTFNVGMGLEASLVLDYIRTTTDNDSSTNPVCPSIAGMTDAREIVYRGLRNGTCQWPVANDSATKIDDVWHSSINSRGDFFSANDPEELTNALNKVVNSILERLSRGSTSSVSSGVVTSSTKAFTPGFDSSNWTGNLFSRPVNANGTFGDVEWDLSCKLTGGFCEGTQTSIAKQFGRRVFTLDKQSNTAVRVLDSIGGSVLSRFETNTQELRSRLNVSTDDLINYLLGDQSKEIQNSGVLRNRESVLADIVHSSPVVQRGPSGSYIDRYWPVTSPEYLAKPYDSNDGIGSYEQYKIDNQDRDNLVYIGSNGGMIHAVNIENGSEQWSFIPSKAFDNIHKLADPLYKHWSFVDNTAVIGDAFFDDKWNTVLISGMRYGGQSFFALDVSDTSSDTPKVLWEFTDEDDADMGFSYGKATIAKIASIGKWVALIPNGYNNSQKDYPDLPSNDPKNKIGDGSAVLYVVDLSNGDLIAKLDTHVGDATTPNGMAPAMPIVSKLPGYSQHSEVGADYAYAGDLYGNLWRFDLSSSSPSDWENASSIHQVVAAQGVKEQPITTQPRVMHYAGNSTSPRNEEKDAMIYFGTGKYIEIPDRSINLIADQFVVGILDGPGNTETIQVSSDKLKLQTMNETDSGNLREFDDLNPVDYGSSNTRGWKLKLPQQGERVANPLARFGQEFILVTSTVTAGDDPCVAGGVSWLLAVDPMTGNKPQFGDLFQEEVITNVDGNPVTTISTGSGIQISDLIIGTPPIVENLGGGNSNIIVEGAETTTVINLKKFTWRRRGWENLLTE